MVRFIDTVRKRIADRNEQPEQPVAKETTEKQAKGRGKEKKASEYRPRAKKASSTPRAARSKGKPAPKTARDVSEKSAPAETRSSTSRPEPAPSPSTTEAKSPARKRPRRRRKPRPAAATVPQPAVAAEPVVAAEPWDPATFEVPEVEGKTRFHDFDLPDEIMHAIADLGFEYCTPIQTAVLPGVMDGKDAAGRAQTGTGKTAAFFIAMFKRMLEAPAPEHRRKGTPRALVIAPTRELVLQLERDAVELSKYLPFKTLAVYGGMDYTRQQNQLREGIIDLVVATPGRLLDFKQKGDIHLSRIETLVIDEADRMLDMGFIPDVRRIVHSMPPRNKRQTLLFSATLTPEVTRLCSQWTQDPLTVEIEPEQVAVDTVEQVIYIVTARQKFTLLYNLITSKDLTRVIVFGNRRDETRKLADYLASYGVSCALLSGEVDQKKRVRTLEAFREGKIRVLVATDVAGRGLHIEGVSHVVNFHLPMIADDYVHRIGRTGRAGATGTAISFACEEEAFQIPELEKYIGRDLPCVVPDEELLAPLPRPTHPRPKRDDRGGRPGGGRPRGSGSRGGGSRGPRGGGGGRGGRSSGRPRGS